MQTDRPTESPSPPKAPLTGTSEAQNAQVLSPSLVATAPGQLKIIKRNGTVVPYTDDKIAVALTKAFLAVEGGTAAASPRIRELVGALTEQVSQTFHRRLPSGGTLHIEDIQDQVELALMRSGEHKVARSYVLYREDRARIRAESLPAQSQINAPESTINVLHTDGSSRPLDTGRIFTIIREACTELSDVDAERIMREALSNMYDGISAEDVATSILITARTLVEEEPNYTYVTARLLLDELRTEALTFLDVSGTGLEQHATQAQMATLYPQALRRFVEKGVELELLAPNLLDYDFQQLGAAMQPERDLNFNYLGL